jgi:hypothetical protein
LFEASRVLQDFEACHLREIQIDDDNVRQARLVDARERLNGFLAVVAALDMGQNVLRAQSFLHQKYIRVVVFDDQNLCRLACH